MTNPLLDPPPIPAARFERLGRAVASLLQTRLDVVLPQAEAVLPLEAAARGLGRVGVAALNLNTSPYGAAIGHWLRQAGATVIGIEAEPHRAVDPEAVERALRANPAGLDRQLRPRRSRERSPQRRPGHHCARPRARCPRSDRRRGFHRCARGAARRLGRRRRRDRATKGLGRASRHLDRRGERPRLACDVRQSRRAARLGALAARLEQGWVDSDKNVIPGTPSPLEILALEAALERVSAEGLQGVQRRHRAPAAASRSGARASGYRPFAPDTDAAVVATTLLAPPDVDALCPRGTRTSRSPRRTLVGLRRARQHGRTDRPHRPARPPRGRARRARSAGGCT